MNCGKREKAKSTMMMMMDGDGSHGEPEQLGRKSVADLPHAGLEWVVGFNNS